MQSCPPSWSDRLPMESKCVDDQQVHIIESAIVPSTLLVVTRIPKCVDKLLDISLDIQVPFIHSLQLMILMSME